MAATSRFGSSDLALPENLREPLLAHLADLKQRYLARGWAGRVGFGKRPALIVIDLALFWTQPQQQIGTNADSVVNASRQVLAAAREAQIPVFFTTFAYDPADPPSPQNKKLCMKLNPGDEKLFELDPRLDRRPTEKLIRKRYASAFKGTNLHEMLTSLGVDTLIVTGLSTSHCVYATCRDATDSFHVIVPREAVGERCEIMHEVNLLDIDIDLGDVMGVEEVVGQIAGIGKSAE
ncbi:MAG: isochorismatase family protein [Pirellulaceae bacterium]|nr:isochorismatase family protein [Pirellulaceae bacterium]